MSKILEVQANNMSKNTVSFEILLVDIKFRTGILYDMIDECRSFRNNIPQKTHSAKNHSAKKTFRNATIWQNHSAKNIRKFENRKHIIRQSNISQPRFGNKLFRNMLFGKIRFRKSSLEISHSENRHSANDTILVNYLTSKAFRD